MNQDYAYLVCVDPHGNHNKFYEMKNENGQLVVTYGRVGIGSAQVHKYGLNEWNKKYNEKVKKGYEDRTNEHVGSKPLPKNGAQSNDYAEIPNEEIRKLVQKLIDCSAQVIRENYTIGLDNVTDIMLENAQKILDELYVISNDKSPSLTKFNDNLIKLFSILPRKMKNVNDNTAKSVSDFTSILTREQNLYDTMQGAYKTQQQQKVLAGKGEKTEKEKNMTILEAFGLEITPCEEKDIATIKKLLQGNAHQFSRAWKVVNKKTEKAYKDCKKELGIKAAGVKLLWHGSTTENWWSILNTGLKLKPNARITGKMFGNGIYFAPKAQKSIGYTSLSGSYWARGRNDIGYMGVYSVACGKAYDTDHTSYKFHDFGFKNLEHGCTYVYAHAGNQLRNDEIIVYREDQLTIKYLVELKK